MTCLFCKQERDESDEHPFPAAVGAVNFVIRFVCKRCNDVLGSEVDCRADFDARLAHARHSAGLPTRPQTVRTTDPAVDPGGKVLRTVFDRKELAAIVAPQPDGDEMVVGRDRIPKTLREMLRAKARKAGRDITDAEVNRVADEITLKFDSTETGQTVKYSYCGIAITIPRLEVPNDKAGATRHDEPGAINRVSSKIGLEIAAHVIGVETLLLAQYDRFRTWVLSGDPDLGAEAVQVVREPDLAGGDALQEHVVRLEDADGLLYASIEYYSAYIVRIRMGPAVGIVVPWAERFPVAQ